MAYELSGKVVLITGAATGIGSLVTRKLMDEGVKHVAVLDVNENAGTELASELNGKYGDNKVKFYKCDVTNDDQLLGYFDAVVKDQGYLDIVVNNAGIMNDATHIYRKEILINVTAVATGTLKALEIMGKDKGGKGGTVINISSTAALCNAPVLPIYFGTKSFVLQFSCCIGMDEYYSRTGVRVVSVCFGTTNTPLLQPQNVGNFNEDIAKLYNAALNMTFLQKPESAAQGVIDSYKHGKSGSVWLVHKDRPAKDITPTVSEAYARMFALVTE